MLRVNLCPRHLRRPVECRRHVLFLSFVIESLPRGAAAVCQFQIGTSDDQLWLAPLALV